MAETGTVGDRNRVRDMYEGVHFFELTSNQRKEHRDRTLHKHPDVLFRIYQEERLHVLLFMPTNAEEWKKVIQDRIQDRTNRPTDLSFQLTESRSVHSSSGLLFRALSWFPPIFTSSDMVHMVHGTWFTQKWVYLKM